MSPQTAMINGHSARLPAFGVRLLDWLRDELGLTGAKEGCGTGHCGACTVLVDEVPRLACCTLAQLTEDCQIMTIEGLAELPEAEPFLDAFAEADVFQCGFCAPGIILLLWATQQADLCGDATKGGDIAETDPAKLLAGNICRCSGYMQIAEVYARYTSQVWRS